MSEAGRHLDTVTTSMDVLELNNLVMKLRPATNQAKVHVVGKLCKNIKMWKAKSGTEEQKASNQRKAERMVEEIAALKKINPDGITKYCLANTLTLDEAMKTNDMEKRILTRIATHKVMVEKVGLWRSQHKDWEALAAFLLSKNTGRRIKNKKKRKIEEDMDVDEKREICQELDQESSEKPEEFDEQPCDKPEESVKTITLQCPKEKKEKHKARNKTKKPKDLTLTSTEMAVKKNIEPSLTLELEEAPTENEHITDVTQKKDTEDKKEPVEKAVEDINESEGIITELNLDTLIGQTKTLPVLDSNSTEKMSTGSALKEKKKKSSFFSRGSDESSEEEEEEEKESEEGDEQIKMNWTDYKQQRFNSKPKGFGHQNDRHQKVGHHKPYTPSKGFGKFNSRSAVPPKPTIAESKAVKTESLHPSWEASRKRKLLAKIPSFQGKKTKFSD